MNSLLKTIDALLITNPVNIRYLTGFWGVAPEEREAYALLTPKQTFLFTNALYLEQAKKTRATVIEISREHPFSKKLAEVLKKGVRLGFEENDVTVTEYRTMQRLLKQVTLVPTKGRVEELRMVKRPDELEDIRAAAKLTDQCFRSIASFLKPGVTETEIAWEIEAFIRGRGASLAFSPIVAFGKNSSIPHYSSTNNIQLTTNNLILLDFGARVNGYASDMTRVVFVGKPSDEWVRAYEAVLMAQEKALAYLNSPHSPSYSKRGRGGVTGAKADRIARDVIENAGFPVYPHSLGHGVGLAIHEAPRLTVKKDVALKPNMIVTIEPAIYVEGNYGVRLEDLVVLKEDSVEVLSKSEKGMIVL